MPRKPPAESSRLFKLNAIYVYLKCINNLIKNQGLFEGILVSKHRQFLVFVYQSDDRDTKLSLMLVYQSDNRDSKLFLVMVYQSDNRDNKLFLVMVYQSDNRDNKLFLVLVYR